MLSGELRVFSKLSSRHCLACSQWEALGRMLGSRPTVGGDKKISHLDEVIRNIDKYRGPGYEVRERITLQHGTGVIIGKKRTGVSAAFGSHSDLIFLYSVDGDATVSQMIEFLERYKGMHRPKRLKEALFVLSGNVDEKGFNELKKKTIKIKGISESIRILRVGKDSIEGKELGTKTISDRQCAYCGATLPPAAQFCPNCAAKVE